MDCRLNKSLPLPYISWSLIEMRNGAALSNTRIVHHSAVTKCSTTKAVSYVVCISLFSMVAVLIYSGFLWSDFNGAAKLSTGNVTHTHSKNAVADHNFVVKKPKGNGGLYETNQYVTEIYSGSELENYKTVEKNLMVVFYASWCGHCRNFVPKFTSVAQKVTSRTKELNDENPLAKYPSTTFLAVNCVTLRKVCESHKVEFYPAIQAFNFVNTGSNTKTKMEGIESELLKFFSKTIFLHGELEKKSAANLKSLTSSVGSLSKVSLSHITEHGEERLHDALSSYLFFMLNEIPEELSNERISSLISFTDMVYRILPVTSYGSKSISLRINTTKTVLESVKLILYKYSKSPFLPRNKIMDAIRTNLNGDFPPKIEWKICGLSEQTISALRGSKRSNNDPGTGYSCGLWLLFHYITLQGEVVYTHNDTSHPPLVATAIMNGIGKFVDNFFGCKECRAHFLQYYNSSLFERDQIVSEDDFQKLQIWLFRLHNLVTSRIRLEKTYGVATLSENITQSNNDRSSSKGVGKIQFVSLILSSLWPTRIQCGHCYSSVVPTFPANVESTKYEDIIQTIVISTFEPSGCIEYLKKAFLFR